MVAEVEGGNNKNDTSNISIRSRFRDDIEALVKSCKWQDWSWDSAQLYESALLGQLGSSTLLFHSGRRDSGTPTRNRPFLFTVLFPAKPLSSQSIDVW